MAGNLITPEELRRIADEQEMAKAREALAKKRQVDDERDQLREAFMSRQMHPEVFERVSRVVKRAAERGERGSWRCAFRANTAPTAAGRSTASSPAGRKA
jgi:hypothetical protein